MTKAHQVVSSIIKAYIGLKYEFFPHQTACAFKGHKSNHQNYIWVPIIFEIRRSVSTNLPHWDVPNSC